VYCHGVARSLSSLGMSLIVAFLMYMERGAIGTVAAVHHAGISD
jgi:hypothetical protein